MSNAVPDFAPGSTFGRYSIVRQLGAGGMGAVYEAIHTGLKKRVAIKTLNPDLAKRPDMLARFIREGEAAARLRHPHVVDISDVGTESGVPYLVMEYLEGEDLLHWLRRDRVLGPQNTADVMLPVCSAVATAHEQGVIHRDLKPANIFITRTLHGIHPKLLDFGISKMDDPTSGDPLLTRTTAVLGTVAYMSPEQAQGARNADARSDQYSLGVILYECATGIRPFGKPASDTSMYRLLHAIVQGEFEHPLVVRPDLPPAMAALIMRSMAREPEQRFGNVRELGAALLPFASPAAQALWHGVFAQYQSATPTPFIPPPHAVPPAALAPLEPSLISANRSVAGVEVQAQAGSRGGLKWALLGAGAFVLAIGAGAVVAGARHSAPPPTSAASVAPAPASPAPTPTHAQPVAPAPSAPAAIVAAAPAAVAAQPAPNVAPSTTGTTTTTADNGNQASNDAGARHSESGGGSQHTENIHSSSGSASGNGSGSTRHHHNNNGDNGGSSGQYFIP